MSEMSSTSGLAVQDHSGGHNEGPGTRWRRHHGNVVRGDLADDVRVAGRGHRGIPTKTSAPLDGLSTHDGGAGNKPAPEPTVWSHAHLIRPGE